MTDRSDKFTWEQDDIDISQCATCRHKWGGAFCDAFPRGIPMSILTNAFDHRNAHPGDHGIRYKPLPGGGPNDSNPEPSPSGQPREKLVALFRAAKVLVTKDTA